MAQTKTQIQALLAGISASPRHRFGQNFMIDQNLVRLVAEAGETAPGDLVIEVGPGTGTLTEDLLARGASVVAVEIDRDLAALLRRRHAAEPRFTLIEGDALAGKHAINADLLAAIAQAKDRSQTVKLVANLPYNIASPLVIDLLIAGVDLLAFTVQKEVADRLKAAAGSEAYGPLSVMAQLLAHVEARRTLPPQAFWPAPRIESALVVMRRRDQLGDRARDFGAFVHSLFSYRRKMLRKSLAQMGHDAQMALTKTGFPEEIRCEELSPAQCLQLFEATER